MDVRRGERRKIVLIHAKRNSRDGHRYSWSRLYIYVHLAVFELKYCEIGCEEKKSEMLIIEGVGLDKSRKYQLLKKKYT